MTLEELEPMRYVVIAAAAIVLNLPTQPPVRPPEGQNSTFKVRRFNQNPIIRPEMLPGRDGDNINGPSLIRAPEWLPNRLGRYYLYFAHHAGTYIRLAYADDLGGPWTVHKPGTLRNEQTVCGKSHIASPDVHVDDAAREIRMYFHCFANGGNDQVTLVATSKDGITFTSGSQPLGPSYFRGFRWKGTHYALAMPGLFLRSGTGLSDFERGQTLFNEHMRHSAVKLDGDVLSVFYTIVGDVPERILLSRIRLAADWQQWKESAPEVILEPETEYEGASIALKPSVRGLALGRLRELRDPAIFEEAGRTYLLYTVAGESGIAIGELVSQQH